MSVYKRGKIYWYKFAWHGKPIRESSKQGNPRVARQMEAAHKVSLAKGEVGIRDRRPIPTLSQFAEGDFLPFVRATFPAKPKTQEHYEQGVKSLMAYKPLADEPLDAITTEKIAGYIAKRNGEGRQVSTINRSLQVLGRMLTLAQEWGKVEKVLPRVRKLPGERQRDRVLTTQEEAAYLGKAGALLREVATVLLDTGMRPEECFRLRWESVRDGGIEIQHGKTEAARRRIPISQRVAFILDMRKATAAGEWVFPAQTKSGHIEPSSVKRQHVLACKGDAKKDGEWAVQPFPLYTLRHTCLTRWAPHMDPYTLAYLAGHSHMATTRRYVHPQEQTVTEALERAQGGHKIGHNGKTPDLEASERRVPIN